MKPWRTLADLIQLEKHGPLDYDIDRQTEAERQAREETANAESREALRQIREARATGSKCLQKACPFPALPSGECRAHAHDRLNPLSILRSIPTKGTGALVRFRTPSHKGAQ